MQRQIVKSQTKMWITVNLASVLLVVTFFYAGRLTEKPVLFFAGAGLMLIITVGSFIKAFIQTGLWKMVHAHDIYLKEEEMQAVLKALKNAYSIFAVMVLLLIYVFAIFSSEPLNVLLAACLLYISHILPAVIIGWKEKYT